MQIDRVRRRHQLLLKASREQHQRQPDVVNAQLRRRKPPNQDAGCETGDAYYPLIEQTNQCVLMINKRLD